MTQLFKINTQHFEFKLILKIEKTKKVMRTAYSSIGSGLKKVSQVRQIRNDFFRIMFPPKNEQTDSTLLLWYLRLTCFCSFWRKLKTPKSYFEINWPLVLLGDSNHPSYFCLGHVFINTSIKLMLPQNKLSKFWSGKRQKMAGAC